jgi:hypothetical protein
MRREQALLRPFRFFWAGLVAWRPIFVACWPVLVT